MYMPFQLSSSPLLPWLGSQAMSRIAAPEGAAAAARTQIRFPGTPPLVRVIAMPADASPNGETFGGRLLSK